MAQPASTLDLLQALAKCIYYERNKSIVPPAATPPQTTSAQLQRAKRLAYDVLLLRAHSPDNLSPDPIEELRFVQFDLSLTDRTRSERFAKCMDQIVSESASGVGDSEKNVLSFLLGLRDTIPDAHIQKQVQCGFGQRFPFKSYTNRLSQHYVREVKVDNRLACFNLNNVKDVESHYNSKLVQRKRVAALKAPASLVTRQKPSEQSLVRAEQALGRVVGTVCHIKCPSWDSLNVPLDEGVYNLPFSTESPSALLYIQRKRAGRLFQPKMLTTAQFIGDLKSLLLGIQTESFIYDKELFCFSICPGASLLNGTPETTAAVAQEFIECGSCCARLKSMCDKNVDFTYKCDGFIFKTLCGSVEEFLRFYEQFVDSFVDETVLALSNRMATLMLQMNQMAKMLAIHPDVGQNPDMVPCGSEFLGYLYKEIIQLTNEDVTILFVYILQQCCRVYFRFFEKWIFHGRMEDPNNELFIEYIDCPPRTKLFWDKAYQIKPQSVPGFLHGIEHVTLLCGKYTMLLQAVRPNHPLLTVEPPSIDVCLSAAQIAALRTKCQAYSDRIQLICGQPISVRDLFAQYAASKADYKRKAAEKFHENMSKWRAEQDTKSVEIRAEHARTRAILERQITELHDRKVQERADNLELDRMYLANEQRLDEEREAAEGQRRLKRIEYYTELGQMVDRHKSEADATVAVLKADLEKETAKTHDMELARKETVPFEEVTQPNTALEDHNKNEVVSDVPQKSPSDLDLLNANDTAHDQAAHNRMIQLGSTFDFQQHLTANDTMVRFHDDNSNPILSPDTLMVNTALAHTEMAKNRSKVMTPHHDLFNQTEPPARPVATGTIISTEQMTDLQRNRHKVLTQEYGFGYSDSLSKPPKADVVPKLHLDLVATNPDATELPFETPMSTSSDTPYKTIEDALSVEVKPTLKLDISRTTFSDGALTQLATGLDTDQSASSVYESARSGFYTCDPADGSVFAFPTTTESTPAAPTVPKSNYIRPTASTANKLQFFRKPSAEPTDQNVLDELANPNISSITHALRMSFVLPLQSHLLVLNNEILKVFLHDFNLIAQFKSLRNYFLMMDGEFASQICHGLLVKLENNASPSEILNSSFLHSLLDVALGSSVMGKDPHADRLSFIVNDIPKEFDLRSPNVLSMLKLSYAIEWPLNLLLNSDTIAQYGLIFTHLLKLRRIRFVLDEASQLLKEVAKRAGPRCQTSPQYGHVQQIRNKFLHFINGLQNHITANALQASWRRFKTELVRAQSVEDIYQMHTRYLKQVKFLCMINNSSREFNDKLDQMWVISLRFYHQLKASAWVFDAHGVYTHPRYAKLLAVENHFHHMVPFILHWSNKLSHSGYLTEIGDFVKMINFNGYYDRYVTKENRTLDGA